MSNTNQLAKVALFSKEYPPYVYGGAGVHVEYLSLALAKLLRVEVRSFGDQSVDDGNLVVRGYPQWDETKVGTDPRFTGAIDAFARSLAMAKDRLDAQLVHCHTWYTDMSGIIAAKLWDIPCVLTIHSLEPLRPWKVEQLGNAYHLSAWMERTAIEQAAAIIAGARAPPRADETIAATPRPRSITAAARACEIPVSFSGTSTLPCDSPRAFQSVSPWRRNQNGVGLSVPAISRTASSRSSRR